MAKQKSYETRQQRKQKGMKISKKQLRQQEKGIDRDLRIEQGYDPAFVGGGAHGGTVEAQNSRARKKSRKDLNKYRNVNTRDLED
ncbi:MAG: hypothetical protein K2Y22_14235 [Candidatus Obscuribacterales bacterium]|nr:hypothetical protein [Candidatus Obscuribacterales bacterium]